MQCGYREIKKSEIANTVLPYCDRPHVRYVVEVDIKIIYFIWPDTVWLRSMYAQSFTRSDLLAILVVFIVIQTIHAK